MNVKKIIKFSAKKDSRGVDYQRWTEKIELEVTEFPSTFKKDICQGYGCRLKLDSNKKDLVLRMVKTDAFQCFQCSKFLLSNSWEELNAEIHNLPDLEEIRQELRKYA